VFLKGEDFSFNCFVIILAVYLIAFTMEMLMSGQGSGGNVLAALCNVFVPGLGQLVQGRIFMALFFFVTVFVGGILHLWSIIDAARFSRLRTVL
jgi:TM2 domain-containing membrane protein YozV